VKLSSKGELNSQKKKLIENSFCIKHPHPIEFIVSADSIEEKEEWINKLVLNIKICQDNFEFNREIKRRVSTARAKVAKEYFGEKYSTEYISNFHNTFQKSKEGRRKNSLRTYKKPTMYKMSTSELDMEDLESEEQNNVEDEDEGELSMSEQSEDMERHKNRLEILLLHQSNRQKLNEKFLTLQYGSNTSKSQSYRDKLKEHRLRKKNT